MSNRTLVILFFVLLASPPFTTRAQSITITLSGEATTTFQGSAALPQPTTPVQRYTQFYSHRWGSSDLQNKIAALPSSPVQSIPVPILFGVGIGDFTQNFGDPRDGGARVHEGEDIMAVKGTPIVSPTEAVVLRTVSGPGEGNAVYTANPGGETYVYMHLDRFGEGVAAGTVLQRGSLIGYVGNTGNAAGGAAHLHFEVHNQSGAPQNPFTRLTAEFTPADKISFLHTILSQTADPTALSQFLANTFKKYFLADQSVGIALPPLISGALGLSATVAAAPTPSSANTVPLQLHAIVPEVPSATVVSTSSFLSRDLKYGMTGEDVRSLQKFLNAHGFTVAAQGAGSSGNETAYFGAATRAAVARFQAAKAIAPSVGYVGPLTRAALGSMS